MVALQANVDYLEANGDPLGDSVEDAYASLGVGQCGIEVTEETLSVGIIDEAVRGEGHFLGAADTLGRMTTEYLYPALADRASPEEWEASGRANLSQRAHQFADRILAEHFPRHIAAQTEANLRATFDIQLAPEAMLPLGSRPAGQEQKA